MKALLERLQGLALQGRRLVAIAGPPGSGKSTLAMALAQHLNDARPGVAAVVAMDGFHYDDAVLRMHGTLARKGAPQTFDLGGLAAMLARLRDNAEPQVAIPVFDRDLEIARAGGALIARDTPLLLVEGNYLLLRDAGWSALRRFFDLTIGLQVPPDELERRLVERWLRHGLAAADALAKARGNDLPNARLVQERSAAADIVLCHPWGGHSPQA